jgi:hypothetical protein
MRGEVQPADHAARVRCALFSGGALVVSLALVVGLGITVATPTPGGLLAAPADPFRYGMYEDANLVGGPHDFAVTAQDLQGRGLGSMVFANNILERDAPLLDVADRLGFGVVFAPQAALRDAWFSSSVPATPAQARSVIDPLVDAVKDHPSLLGYNIVDDAPDWLADKTAIAVQTFQERDPAHPAMPVFIPNSDVALAAAQPNVILTYVYPVLAGHRPCDVFPYGPVDQDAITSWLGHVAELNGRGVPVWVILQAHGAVNGYNPLSLQPTTLREPTREEIREQYWLAVAAGVKGVFWFTYSTQQFWTGLRDNPPLLAEVTELGGRTRRVSGVLAALHRADDQFAIDGPRPVERQFQPYVGTLAADDGTLYAVAVNRSCADRALTITSPTLDGRLVDVETGTGYELGSPIPFRPGDGHLLRLETES